MAVGHEDGSRIPVAITVVLGGLDQALDFLLGQVLSATGNDINRYIYQGRRQFFGVLTFHDNCRSNQVVRT